MCHPKAVPSSVQHMTRYPFPRHATFRSASERHGRTSAAGSDRLGARPVRKVRSIARSFATGWRQPACSLDRSSSGAKAFQEGRCHAVPVRAGRDCQGRAFLPRVPQLSPPTRCSSRSTCRGTGPAVGRHAGDVRLFQYGSRVGRVAVHGGECDDASHAAPDRWPGGAGRVLRPHAPVTGCAVGAARAAPADAGTRPAPSGHGQAPRAQRPAPSGAEAVPGSGRDRDLPQRAGTDPNLLRLQ